MRLTNFYVTWPACTPSRGSILTGRYPQRNGLYDMIRNNEVNYGHRFTEEEYAVSPEMTLGLDVREITIAQVHGYAIAGGCELAMMADLVVAADNTQLGHPGLRGLGTSRTGVI